MIVRFFPELTIPIRCVLLSVCVRVCCSLGLLTVPPSRVLLTGWGNGKRNVFPMWVFFCFRKFARREGRGKTGNTI
uniref:Putative secreted protein n=1 Tax=Anopheles darlingi TaxID=43151 RepID=A0A2M4D2U3_ANODA